MRKKKHQPKDPRQHITNVKHKRDKKKWSNQQYTAHNWVGNYYQVVAFNYCDNFALLLFAFSFIIFAWYALWICFAHASFSFIRGLQQNAVIDPVSIHSVNVSVFHPIMFASSSQFFLFALLCLHIIVLLVVSFFFHLLCPILFFHDKMHKYRLFSLYTMVCIAPTQYNFSTFIYVNCVRISFRFHLRLPEFLPAGQMYFRFVVVSR